ncbi:MAG: NAD(P)H-hydrate epimerase [Polyangiales bacterium]
MVPEIDASAVPCVTTAQMIEVDRAMIEDYGILLIQMMENAGRHLATLARIRFFEGSPQSKKVAVLAGSGGNGGGALVCARRLSAWGAEVEVFATHPPGSFRDVSGHQHAIVERLGVAIHTTLPSADAAFDLVVDGIIGYGLGGVPRGSAADLIEWTRAQAARVLSLDVPSGIDTTTGTAFVPSVVADATMTLALPKSGLLGSAVRRSVGELYLADIGVPPQLYRAPALGLDVPHLFAEGDIVRVRLPG